MLRSRLIILITLCPLLSPVFVQAQQASQVDLSGFWSAKYERQPTGQVLVDKLPESAIFVDDAGGEELEEGNYAGLTLSETALAAIEAYDFEDEFLIANTCKAPSVAFYMQAPFPIEIHQGRDMVVIQVEYFDLYRIIFMDGRDHPENMPHSRQGHSVGHWEGDELVVDTRYISPGTFMNNGFDHSEDIHMIERFKMSEDGQILWLTQVYEDPEVFEGLAARYMAWGKMPGEHVYPYECDPSFGR